MSIKSSILPLDPVDIGGVEPMADELVNEEVIGWLTSIDINAKNSVNDAMLMKEYEQFLNSVESEPIVVTMSDVKFDNAISGSYYDDIDFSPDMSYEKSLITIEDPLKYYIHNPLWMNSERKSQILPPMNHYYSMENKSELKTGNHSGLEKVTASKSMLGETEKITFIKSGFKYRHQAMNDGRRILDMVKN
jgi:hypothetical protein